MNMPTITNPAVLMLKLRMKPQNLLNNLPLAQRA